MQQCLCVLSLQVAECAFVLLLMASYWVTEVIPLSMTAMLPAILFPIFGIMKSSDVSPSVCYLPRIIYLQLGYIAH